jgi:hypothetical protein
VTAAGVKPIQDLDQLELLDDGGDTKVDGEAHGDNGAINKVEAVHVLREHAGV